jgi:hypothetical protein
MLAVAGGFASYKAYSSYQETVAAKREERQRADAERRAKEEEALRREAAENERLLEERRLRQEMEKKQRDAEIARLQAEAAPKRQRSPKNAQTGMTSAVGNKNAQQAGGKNGVENEVRHLNGKAQAGKKPIPHVSQEALKKAQDIKQPSHSPTTGTKRGPKVTNWKCAQAKCGAKATTRTPYGAFVLPPPDYDVTHKFGHAWGMVY